MELTASVKSRLEMLKKSLRSFASRFVLNREFSQVGSGKSRVTVESTETGRTRMNAEELYKSEKVQEFIKKAKSLTTAK